MLLRYNPPRGGRGGRGGVYGGSIGQGDIGRRRRRKGVAALWIAAEPPLPPPAGRGWQGGEEERKEKRRNGYEEIPPPVIPPQITATGGPPSLYLCLFSFRHRLLLPPLPLPALPSGFNTPFQSQEQEPPHVEKLISFRLFGIFDLEIRLSIRFSRERRWRVKNSKGNGCNTFNLAMCNMIW